MGSISMFASLVCCALSLFCYVQITLTLTYFHVICRVIIAVKGVQIQFIRYAYYRFLICNGIRLHFQFSGLLSSARAFITRSIYQAAIKCSYTKGCFYCCCCFYPTNSQNLNAMNCTHSSFIAGICCYDAYYYTRVCFK